MKKDKLIVVLSSVIILVSLIVLARCDHKPLKVIPDRKATITDNVVTREQQKKIDRLDSMLSVRNGELMISTSNLLKQQDKNSYLKQCNDTLSSYYRQHHDLQTCDSLVMAKQLYIEGLESEKDSLYILTHTLTGIVGLEHQKSARMDTIIKSKEMVIDAYARQMDRINCTSEWAIKHKFWAWLFGIKCYK